MASIRTIMLAALLVGTLPSARGAEPFKLERYEEDYSVASSGSDSAPLWARIKHLQLSPESYLSLGGEVRERVDTHDAPAFGIGASKDTYDLQRLLLHADGHFGDRIRVFVQLGKHDEFDKARMGVTDKDGVDVQNAFLDVNPDLDKRLTVRVGRQDLVLNAPQRFVSVREGPNMRQSFDGVSTTWLGEALRLKAFFTKPVLYKPGRFDDSMDSSQRFLGADVTYTLSPPRDTLQLYALELDRDNVVWGSKRGDEKRRSIAARWAGHVASFDHDAEVMYQGGSFGSDRIRAWALALDAGYKFDAPWSPRIGLEFDAGSGDRDARDGTLQTFNPMFPKGPFFDPSSLHSWANLLLTRATLSVTPIRQLTMSFSAGERWRQSRQDAVYTQPYIPLASTLGNQERRVGDEYEFNMTWQVNRHVVVLVQALHVTAGPAIRQAGGKSVNFGMLTGQFRF